MARVGDILSFFLLLFSVLGENCLFHSIETEWNFKMTIHLSGDVIGDVQRTILTWAGRFVCMIGGMFFPCGFILLFMDVYVSECF